MNLRGLFFLFLAIIFPISCMKHFFPKDPKLAKTLFPKAAVLKNFFVKTDKKKKPLLAAAPLLILVPAISVSAPVSIPTIAVATFGGYTVINILKRVFTPHVESEEKDTSTSVELEAVEVKDRSYQRGSVRKWFSSWRRKDNGHHHHCHHPEHWHHEPPCPHYKQPQHQPEVTQISPTEIAQSDRSAPQTSDGKRIIELLSTVSFNRQMRMQEQLKDLGIPMPTDMSQWKISLKNKNESEKIEQYKEEKKVLSVDPEIVEAIAAAESASLSTNIWERAEKIEKLNKTLDKYRSEEQRKKQKFFDDIWYSHQNREERGKKAQPAEQQEYKNKDHRSAQKPSSNNSTATASGSPDPEDPRNNRKINTVSKQEFFNKPEIKQNYKSEKDGSKSLKEDGTPVENADELQWDHRHNDVELYKDGKHMGSLDPATLKIYKPAVPHRKAPSKTRK